MNEESTQSLQILAENRLQLLMKEDSQVQGHSQLMREEIAKQPNLIAELGRIKMRVLRNLFQLFNKMIIEYILSNFITFFYFAFIPLLLKYAE